MSKIAFCRACGKQVKNTARKCSHCGAEQIETEGKNKSITALLAFFLGSFGAHRFYLHQWWGIFYILFIWTGIPQLLGLIEGIVFLSTSDEKWDKRHNDGLPSGASSRRVTVIVACSAAVVALFLLSVIGIVAVVALPAYRDFTAKTKMLQVHMEGSKITSAYNAYIDKNVKLPTKFADLGVPLSTEYFSEVEMDPKEGTITLTLNFGSMNDKHYILMPQVDAEQKVTWRCASYDIKATDMPSQCRQKAAVLKD